MQPLVDVHCHLTSPELAADLEEVLHRASQAGITRLISVGEDFEDNQRVLELAARHPQVLPALGHYPAHLDEAMADRTEALLRQHRSRVVAIGEVGLDHWLAKEPEALERQQAIFTRFVRLAMELELPLSVHSRSAGHHAITLLTALGATRVCLHAFDGKARYAREAAEAGFYLSVPPSVVRSPQKQRLVKAVPLSRLLLETDSPVLGPDQGKRNEPANLLHSVRMIAEIKGIDSAEVRRACAENASALFGPALT
ncbi:MAG: TatD family hydrolase [Polyangia bacterium]|jgi:TatD DNase family protein|nr:TatD family hydrolase [Polyangia bacterium]